MFDDKFFDDWLDTQAQKVMEQVASGQSISSDQMMILMLKLLSRRLNFYK